MRTTLLYGVALCLVLANGSLALSQDKGLSPLERLEKEAPAIWKQVIPKYQSVEIEGTLVTTIRKSENESKSNSIEVLILDAPDLYLAKELHIGKNIEGITGCTSQYKFSLAKYSPTANWTIARMDPGINNESERKEKRIDTIGKYTPLTNIHYSVWDVQLSDFFRHPAIKVDSAEEILLDDLPCIKVSFTCNESNRRDMLSFLKKGEVVLCPKLAWCAVAQTLTIQQGPQTYEDSFLVHFNEGAAEFPTPKDSRRITLPSEERSFEFKRYTPRTISAKEISLTTFGLPEVDARSIPGNDSQQLIVGNEATGKTRFAFGFAGLAMATIGYWLVRRRSK